MNYKIKENFEIKEIAGELLLIPRGADTVDYNFVTVFNDTGAVLLRELGKPVSVEALSQILVEKYNISSEDAMADTEAFIQKMLDEDIIKAV